MLRMVGIDEFTLKANEAKIKKVVYRLDSFCWGEWNENIKIDSTGNFSLYTSFYKDGVKYISDTIIIEIKKKE